MNIKGLTHTEPYEPITVEDYHEIHLALWNWLIENPLEAKCKWPGWELVRYHSSNHCSACDIAEFWALTSSIIKCKYCPIKIWRRAHGTGCLHSDSVYQEWHDSRSVVRRTETATILRDLEWFTTKENEDDSKRKTNTQ